MSPETSILQEATKRTKHPGRIDNDNDWIRQELACAIESERNIIPVHLDHNIPGPHDLPADIRPVALCHGVMYSHEHFDSTIEQLIKLLVHRNLPTASRPAFRETST
jgi:hypothetical protein